MFLETSSFVLFVESRVLEVFLLIYTGGSNFLLTDDPSGMGAFGEGVIGRCFFLLDFE